MIDVAAEFTTKIIDAIEGGEVNGKWVRPWNLVGEWPTNPVTGKRYSAGNALYLMILGGGFFAGYGQWQSIGAQVRKGSKSVSVYAPMLKKDEDGEVKLVSYRVVRVFSHHDVDGWEPPVTTLRAFNPIVEADKIIKATGADIRHGGDRAFYAPSHDHIQMPEAGQFLTDEGYYATLLHELVHWSGHESRLDRELNSGRFGTEAYAFEELVAEIGSTFLCGELGIHQGEIPENHLRYVKGWLKILRGDKRAIMHAASLAQKAVTFILNGAKVPERKSDAGSDAESDAAEAAA